MEFNKYQQAVMNKAVDYILEGSTMEEAINKAINHFNHLAVEMANNETPRAKRVNEQILKEVYTTFNN